MEYAVFRTGGKQYKVKKGDTIELDRLDAQPNKEISFREVLLYVSNGESKIGTPLVKGAYIKAKMVENLKGDKIRVAKFKAKARYRRVRGFRHSLSKIFIDSIAIDKK